MYSVDFEEIAKLQHDANWDELERIMVDAARRLERGGADFTVIATNTMHMFADQIEESVRIPLLHIGDATGESLQKAGIEKVGLLGTKFTMEQGFLKDRLSSRFDVETIVPSGEDRGTIHSVIYNELVQGDLKESSRQSFLDVIRKLVAGGAEGIVLGCTEIPLLITQDLTDTPLFDTTRLHAEKAVEWALK
jgi:aspartate racemase